MFYMAASETEAETKKQRGLHRKFAQISTEPIWDFILMKKGPHLGVCAINRGGNVLHLLGRKGKIGSHHIDIFPKCGWENAKKKNQHKGYLQKP